MADYRQPDYNIYFDRDDIESGLACLDEYGYCVIRQMIDQDMVEELKASIDENLDPDRDLPPASNKYHMMLWKLVDVPGCIAVIAEPIWRPMKGAILAVLVFARDRFELMRRGHCLNLLKI